MSSSLSRMCVFVVDSIGAHRGMHYYNFALANALGKVNVEVILLSTAETANHKWKPEGLTVEGVFQHIYGNKPKWIRGLWYVWANFRIAWLAWRKRPDLVHYHFYQLPLLDRLLVKWLKALGIIVIATIHDVIPLKFGQFSSKRNNQQYLTLYSLLDGLIVHSSHSFSFLKSLDSVLMKKTVIIPQGNYFHVVERMQDYPNSWSRLNIDCSIPKILVFGTIKSNKRIDWAIRMLPRVLESVPNARLMIVGQPQNQDISSYIDLAKGLEVNNHIDWKLMAVDDDLLISYFSFSDIVLLPYDWIYQSAVMVMAMSFAKPIVATSVGGNKDYILQGKTGMLVNVGDIDTMATTVIDLLQNREKAKRMGAAAKDLMGTKYSWDQIALETVNFYHSILK